MEDDMDRQSIVGLREDTADADEEVALEDADVATERQRILGDSSRQDIITLDHLRKEYPGPPHKVGTCAKVVGTCSYQGL
jgi:hypothetical protein